MKTYEVTMLMYLTSRMVMTLAQEEEEDDLFDTTEASLPPGDRISITD